MYYDVFPDPTYVDTFSAIHLNHPSVTDFSFSVFHLS